MCVCVCVRVLGFGHMQNMAIFGAPGETRKISTTVGMLNLFDLSDFCRNDDATNTVHVSFSKPKFSGLSR